MTDHTHDWAASPTQTGRMVCQGCGATIEHTMPRPPEPDTSWQSALFGDPPETTVMTHPLQFMGPIKALTEIEQRAVDRARGDVNHNQDTHYVITRELLDLITRLRGTS